MAEAGQRERRRRARLTRERVIQAALSRRRRRRAGVADHPLAGQGARRQADVGLLPRRQQGRDPRRARRHRLQRDRAPGARWRLAVGDAQAGVFGTRGPRADTAGRSGCWSRAPIPGPANLRHHDTVIATLRAAGFSAELTAHAYALIDSYVYGFALQEAALPFEGPDSVGDVAEPIMERMADGRVPASRRHGDVVLPAARLRLRRRVRLRSRPDPRRDRADARPGLSRDRRDGAHGHMPRA